MGIGKMGWERAAVTAVGMVHPKVSLIFVPSPIYELFGEEKVFKIQKKSSLHSFCY